QGITINARIDSSRIFLGDQVMFYIDVTKPKNEKIIFPHIKDTLSKAVEIIETKKTDTVFSDKNIHTLRQSFIITSFDTGNQVIPPQAFLWEHEGRTDTLFSNQASIFVDMVAIDTTQNTIKDIKAPFEAPFSFDEIIPYILWGLLAIAVIVAAIYVFNRIRKKKPIIPIPEKPKIPAHITAIEKLNELQQKKLWQNNQIKKFHIELTTIVRTYIEDRFDIAAMESISQEIIEDCQRNKEISEPAIKALKQMLPLADLVKFAKWQPMPDENDTCLKNAFLFVESTIPVAKPQEETKVELLENNVNHA
ncbi:MAG: hypothetical protein CVU05_13815, partial [Bacteroidetes bacterium HGW-Bacteroidetes-21]